MRKRLLHIDAVMLFSASMVAWVAAGCGEPPGQRSEALILSNKSPDTKVVQYIDQQTFNVAACVVDLALHGVPVPWAACPLAQNAQECLVAGCSALWISANGRPPASFTASSWASWVNSKEYRCYIHIPSVQVTCSNGEIVGYRLPGENSEEQSSYGFTKTPVGFSDADVYAPPFNGYTHSLDSEGRCMTISDKRASRISNPERVAQFGLFGYDAPFIYNQVEERICCDGSPTTVRAQRTEFPTARLYINDVLQGEQQQTNLGDFVVHGGAVLNLPRHGNLGPRGGDLWYQSPPPFCPNGDGLYCGDNGVPGDPGKGLDKGIR